MPFAVRRVSDGAWLSKRGFHEDPGTVRLFAGAGHAATALYHLPYSTYQQSTEVEIVEVEWRVVAVKSTSIVKLEKYPSGRDHIAVEKVERKPTRFRQEDS